MQDLPVRFGGRGDRRVVPTPISAQGGGFAEPWVAMLSTDRSEGAEEACGVANYGRRSWMVGKVFTIRRSDPFFRSIRATRFLSSIPRVPQSLHPGLSPVTASR